MGSIIIARAPDLGSWAAMRTVDEALQEITDRKGTLYDAAVVDACLRVFAAQSPP